jgi:hypothetical protein
MGFFFLFLILFLILNSGTQRRKRPVPRESARKGKLSPEVRRSLEKYARKIPVPSVPEPAGEGRENPEQPLRTTVKEDLHPVNPSVREELTSLNPSIQENLRPTVAEAGEPKPVRQRKRRLKGSPRDGIVWEMILERKSF